VDPEARRKRLVQLGAVAVFAAVVLVVAIVVSQGGDDPETTSEPSASAGVFDGIPQSGSVLGDPDAEATLIEFADPQCPFCAQYALGALPAVVDEYVRSGELALQLELLTFIGPDSQEAARMAVAASEQDLMWQFVDGLYANQGAENSGYVDEDFLREVGGQVEGLDVDAALEESGSEAVAAALQESSDLATELGINSTPGFVLERDGGDPEVFEPPSLDPQEFTEALGAALDGG
jgi:protein-disulfide isomerase